jgi:hypothetical protein
MMLLGDGAYINCEQVWCPYRITDLVGDDRPMRLKFNIKLRRYRVLDEWFFSRLKRTFRKLDHEWRDTRHSISVFVLACCLLLNWLLEQRNIYLINDPEYNPNDVNILPIHSDDNLPNEIPNIMNIDIEAKYDD